jgi:DNA polymerase-1
MFVAVLDAPVAGRGPFDGVAGEVLLATIRAVAAAAGEAGDARDRVAVAYVSAEPTPGDRPPKIAVIRERREALLEEVAALDPRVVLAAGSAATTALSGAPRNVVLKKWRGQMRWLDLPRGRRVPWVSTVSAGAVAKSPDLYRDLSADVWKAWTRDAPESAPVVEVVVPTDIESLRASLAVLASATVVSCDVETTGLRPYADELLSVGFGAVYEDLSGYAVIVPRELVSGIWSSYVMNLCWDALYTRDRHRTVLHNGKFDLAFLSQWLGEGIPREALIGDTMLLAYLLDERPNRPTSRCRGVGLKDLAAVRYDAEDYSWDWAAFYKAMREDPASANWDGLYGYQALDVYYTARLWHDLAAEADEESPRLLEAHDQVLIPAAKTLSACELRGAPVDREWLGAFAAWLRRRIERRERVLESVVLTLGAPDGLSIGSPTQVADLMYDVWKMTPDVRRRKHLAPDAEDRSTDKEHIEGAVLKYRSWPTDPDLRRAARWLRTLLRWRADQKNLSTYSETILERADSVGRVHASFWLHGTSTGRISSSDPNLQNIPAVSLSGGKYVERRSGKPTAWPARRGFASAPGWLIVEADFSQLELRVAAALSGDERLRQVFVDGKDIHREVAATMFSKQPEEVTKPERFLAKAVDFGLIYGRTGKAIAKGAEMQYFARELHGRPWDEATADAFIAKFMRGYPQLAAWLTKNAAETLERYYVETPLGRRRRFPFRPRSKWERLAIERQANNTPIQGTASDLCLMAMSRIEARLPPGAYLLFPVHDSIVLEVHEARMAEVEAILREEMEVDFMGVPMAIDVESGTSWADVH